MMLSKGGRVEKEKN